MSITQQDINNVRIHIADKSGEPATERGARVWLDGFEHGKKKGEIRGILYGFVTTLFSLVLLALILKWSI